MSGWVLWVIAACAFGVGEMLTGGLFLAPFALGGVSAAITDVAGAGELASWLVFVAGLGAGPGRSATDRALAHEGPASDPHRAAALIGQQAIVLERIANDEGIGW